MTTRKTWFSLPPAPRLDSEFSELWNTLDAQLSESKQYFEQLKSVDVAIAEIDVTEGYCLPHTALKSKPPELLSIPPIGQKIKGKDKNGIITQESQGYEPSELLYIPPQIHEKLKQISEGAEGVVALIQSYLSDTTKENHEDFIRFRSRVATRYLIHQTLASANLPMSKASKNALEKSCITDGILDPLKGCYLIEDGFILDANMEKTEFSIHQGEIFKGNLTTEDGELPAPFLWDGFNRAEIAETNELPVKVVIDRVFNSLQEAQKAIIEFQSARRNLTKMQMDFQVGEWLILEGDSKNRNERAKGLFGLSDHPETIRRKRIFAENVRLLANQIEIAIAEQTNNPSLDALLHQCNSDRLNFQPAHFIGKFLEILPQKPGSSYPEGLAAIAQHPGQTEFVINFLSHTFKIFEDTGKFPAIPKLQPEQTVKIQEGEFRGKEGVIQSFTQGGNLALVKIPGSEAIAQIPLDKLRKQPPQVVAATPEKNDSPTETANLPPQNEAATKATEESLDPPKKRVSLSQNQSSPTSPTPTPAKAPPTPQEIKAAIALLEEAGEAERLAPNDMARLSLLVDKYLTF